MEEISSEAMGSLEAATKRAAELLDIDPALAAEQAQEILDAIPNHPPAMFLLAIARRRSGNPQAAIELLEPLLNAQHEWGAAYFEYGASLGDVGRGDDAIQALLKAVKFAPDHPEAWRHLADHLVATGDAAGADAAYARHIQCSTRDPYLQDAAAAMVKNDVATAERLLKRHLYQKPTDVPAIRMLAEVAIRCARNEEAEHLLERCLELAPSFAAARFNYAMLLHRRNDESAALVHIEQCLEVDPGRPNYRNLCAVILTRVGEYERAGEIYARLLEEYPGNAKVWLSYGHVAKTAGQPEKCIELYRKAIALDAAFGDAYWSLANLKTFRFSDDDLAAMHEQLADPQLSDENRWHFHFALGKAYEDAKEYSKSFDHYAKGNDLFHASGDYSPDLNTKRVQRLQKNFNSDFYRDRQGLGCDAPDPIFIVGMPRSGSTLLEQILSSHSAVEGTMELPDMITLAQELRQESGRDEVAVHAEVLAEKSAAELRALGELYIERTRIHRKTDRPFFIDKLPNNFIHVGMIHLLLPNAKIIDARRHPMGCCFSNFKQFYASGQNFSYNLDDLGRFYHDYVDLMAHFDTLLPGRIHRVFYEDTVADTESTVRRLLEYCGLEFEPACLRFFENERAVRTASSEQVRQPIYKEGLEQWQHYEEWLDPLKSALGSVLDAYPAVPQI